MQRANEILLGIVLAVVFADGVGAQQSTPTAKPQAERTQPLVLTETIPLEGIKGRFDHFGFGGGRIFVAALGSNAVEAINVGARTLDHSITGVPDPQGVVYSPETKKLFVASGSAGKVYIYNSATYDLITTVDFEGGADNLRYDAANKRVYVGCGDDEKTGAIGTIDAVSNQRLDATYKLGGEPESFQLEKSGPIIYVNVPDLKEIVVVNRETKEVSHWKLQGVESNFPMALDEADHRLMIVTRTPPRLVVYDTNSGKAVATLPCVADVDDLYYDANHKRVYVPGGQGFIDVFQQKDADRYERLARIPTVIGARTAGYTPRVGKKGLDRIFLAVPYSPNKDVAVWVYTVQE